MENIERRVRREVRAMTRQEVITKAIARQITWLQAAQILGPAAPRSGKALLEMRVGKSIRVLAGCAPRCLVPMTR